MISRVIDNFFDSYAAAMNSALAGVAPDLDFITGSFSNFVVGANPLGVFGSKNDEAFKNSIRQGIDFYKEIGITSMNVHEKKVTALNEFHCMVSVFWKSCYRKNDRNDEVHFEVVYILQVLNQIPRIFAFVTGDEQAELKKIGLIPG